MESHEDRRAVVETTWRPLAIRDALRRTAVVLALLAAIASGCAGPPPAEISPASFEPLAEDEGFLVVQVDSDAAVESIRMDGRVVIHDLQPGQHLWLIRTKAGRRRWTTVKLRPQLQGDDSIRPEALGVLNEREFEFDVEAGAVNYPGEIMIRMNLPEHGIELGYTVRNRNHSAMAIRKLLKSHSALLAAHPIRYAGSSGDEFLQFYTRERDRRTQAGEGDRASAEVE